ncbi:hypothetical protein C8Q80DRAFT_1272353 [Daedaleopsis nitida]|nr:hypothetical protein C8Q80DRAFT_1272353 [Daedaleopsis nitida]
MSSQVVICSQEQWNLYKLDPFYDCHISELSTLPIVSKASDPKAATKDTRKHPTSSSASKPPTKFRKTEPKAAMTKAQRASAADRAFQRDESPSFPADWFNPPTPSASSARVPSASKPVPPSAENAQASAPATLGFSAMSSAPFSSLPQHPALQPAPSSSGAAPLNTVPTQPPSESAQADVSTSQNPSTLFSSSPQRPATQLVAASGAASPQAFPSTTQTRLELPRQMPHLRRYPLTAPKPSLLPHNPTMRGQYPRLLVSLRLQHSHSRCVK